MSTAAFRAPSVSLAFLGLTLLMGGSARAAVGGPDTFGYTWRDSEEVGFDYAWFNPGVTATDVSVFGDDTTTGFLPFSFAFPYYGGVYSQFAACSNGWLSLVDGTSASYTNGALPNGVAPIGPIAAFWDDLRLTDGISKVLVNDLGDRLVVTWRGAHDLGNEAALNDFQIILHLDGRIIVQYQSLLGDLTSCTLGIESPDQTDGLTVYNNEVGGVPMSSYAVEFSPPVPVPNTLDCAGAVPVPCGDWVTGDLTAGAANQDAYLCSRNDYSGREQVWTLDVPVPTTFRLILEGQSGNPGMIVLDGCDPNRCVTAPTNNLQLNDVVGTYTIVVDCAPGEEGRYRLRVECLPIAPDLDCVGAEVLSCPDVASGDLRTSAANQDYYWCTETDYSGAEDVYFLDLPSPATLQLDLTALSGNPDLIILDGCDPGNCLGTADDMLILDDVMGPIYIVVESRPGDEGAYELAINCLQDSFTFCGTGLYESEPYGATANGSWLVFGWLYHPGDTHNFALRVDGGAQTYTHDTACTQFPTSSYGVLPPSGPGFVNWGAPEGSVQMTMSETNFGGCCGLLVNVEVTNTDVVPHDYDFRIYHDTAFGTGNGTCSGGTIDGGPIRVMGTTYYDEQDLLALGADTCEGQVQMTSAEDPAGLASSFEMLPPNTPTAMEFLDWNDGGLPCTDWQGLVDGESVGQCFEDSSLLLIWHFPNGAGQLAPGESASASYRIGYHCAFPCNVVCEDPILATGAVADLGPCNDGIELTWDAALFPGAGNGVYHVRRSTVSFADARLQAPITPALGLTAPTFIDSTPPPNQALFYVVEAESLDFPGCGSGTRVLGSTDEIEIGPIIDSADTAGPEDVVGNTLRATAHTADTVDFNWLLAALPAAGESYRVLRADGNPQGPFVQVGDLPGRSWTDPNAPPSYSPAHVWFYDVRLADDCGNLSLD